jgi:hypothetical protein
MRKQKIIIDFYGKPFGKLPLDRERMFNDIINVVMTVGGG